MNNTGVFLSRTSVRTVCTVIYPRSGLGCFKQFFVWLELVSCFGVREFNRPDAGERAFGVKGRTEVVLFLRTIEKTRSSSAFECGIISTNIATFDRRLNRNLLSGAFKVEM